MTEKTGMTVSILRPADGADYSNGGPSSKAAEALLVGEGIPRLSRSDGDRPVFRLVKRMLSGGPYFHAEPDGPTGRHRMFGGNFLYTSDSRFRALTGYPIPVHDREERPEPSRKIPTKHVSILWTESTRQDLVGVPMSWAAINLSIRAIAQLAPEGGAYDKTAFLITWEDGQTYEGRIDVTRAMATSFRALTEHVENFNRAQAGLRCPAGLSPQAYRDLLAATEQHSPGAAQASADLLENRDIGWQS